MLMTSQHPALAKPIVLQINGLCFGYPQRPLFSHLTFGIPAGVSLVLGGDGSGKTSLLQILAGALPAQAGELQINGVSLKEAPNAYLARLFWADPRSDDLDQITALDYFERLHLRYPGFDVARVSDLTEGLALGPHLHKPLFMLSTGSKRKVWLAGAFAAGAAITLLDEPFAALDKPSIGFVTELLEEAAQHPTRAWVVAAYEAPAAVPLACVIHLPAS